MKRLFLWSLGFILIFMIMFACQVKLYAYPSALCPNGYNNYNYVILSNVDDTVRYYCYYQNSDIKPLYIGRDLTYLKYRAYTGSFIVYVQPVSNSSWVTASSPSYSSNYTWTVPGGGLHVYDRGHGVNLLFDDDNSSYDDSLGYSDYYINDQAKIFSESDITKIHDILKKWEKNTNCQFFIKTYQTDIINEVQDMVSFGQTKSSTGEGSVTLYIQKRSNGSVRLGLGLSSNMLKTLPYSKFYNRVWDDLMRSIEDSSDVGVDRICHFFNQIYRLNIYAEREPDKNDLFGTFTTYHADRGYVDLDATEWDLVNGKLDTKFPLLFPIFMPYDQYNSGLNVIWFGEIETYYTPTPLLSSTPPPGTGLPPPTYDPSATPLPTPIILDGQQGGGGINWPGIPNILDGKLPTGGLKGSLEKLGQLTDTDIAPVISLNMHDICDSVTTSFNIQNPYAPDYCIKFDFAEVEQISFMGVSVLAWFKNIISAFIIYLTALSIWKVIIPDKAISD